MQPFQITNPEKLRLILQAFGCLDDIRWSTMANYNLINYFRDDLTPDEKLLTHWLCYVTDRQMAFMRVWDVGGYVLSHLVRSYTNGDHDPRSLLKSYVHQDGTKVRIECQRKGENAKLAKYDITGPTVEFASRFITDDLVRIYRTLVILDSCGRSLSGFIAATLHDDDDHRQNIKRMATALNGLTYDVDGGFSVEQLEAGLDRMDQDAANFDPESSAYPTTSGRKRFWCSLRDFLKSPEFNPLFVEGLREAGFQHVKKWRRTNRSLRKALDSLELPGDVWNNAKVFRHGLFSPHTCHERKSWDMPRTIREIYDLLVKKQKIDFYPEQLDVTFDFVPRMCDQEMCGVCLFGNGVGELCHRQSDYLCPVALVACGYKHKCSPDGCRLKGDGVKGLCERPG